VSSLSRAGDNDAAVEHGLRAAERLEGIQGFPAVTRSFNSRNQLITTLMCR
jgi:hypothetical protein